MVPSQSPHTTEMMYRMLGRRSHAAFAALAAAVSVGGLALGCGATREESPPAPDPIAVSSPERLTRTPAPSACGGTSTGRRGPGICHAYRRLDGGSAVTHDQPDPRSAVHPHADGYLAARGDPTAGACRRDLRAPGKSDADANPPTSGSRNAHGDRVSNAHVGALGYARPDSHTGATGRGYADSYPSADGDGEAEPHPYSNSLAYSHRNSLRLFGHGGTGHQRKHRQQQREDLPYAGQSVLRLDHNRRVQRREMVLHGG